MAKKTLGEGFLEIHVKEEGKSAKTKKIALTENEIQLVFETLQNKRENGVDEDIEEIFS